MKPIIITFLFLLYFCPVHSQETMYQHFLNPPTEARPLVWWHWMDGYISRQGIKEDLSWMKRIGLGGFQYFEAGLSRPGTMAPTGVNRLKYLSNEWKTTFGYAIQVADSLHLEADIASCPGWSCAGGPWVKAEDAMKKLTWRTMRLKGGKTWHVQLPSPFRFTGFYQNAAGTDENTSGVSKETYYKDIAVLAVRLDDDDKSMEELGAQVTTRHGGMNLKRLEDGDYQTIDTLINNDKDDSVAWLQISFPHPQTIRSLGISDGTTRGWWDLFPATVSKWLEWSEDGRRWQHLTDIPTGGTNLLTFDIPETRAKYFRLVMKKPKMDPVLMKYAQLMHKPIPEATGNPLAEFWLSPVARVNNAEEKAGFTSHYDYLTYQTPASNDVATDVIDLTEKVDSLGWLTWKAPKGNWKVLRFGQSLLGKMNHPAPENAIGLEVDKMDSAAVARYLDHYLDLYTQTLQQTSNSMKINGLLVDSYEAGNQTWTSHMEEEFMNRRGYNLRPWLPVLTGIIVESTEASEKFLFDWRKTLGELLAENFYQVVSDVTRRRGMKTYFESHEGARPYVADGMDVKSYASVPMGALWCHPLFNRMGAPMDTQAIADLKESASVAHVYGQNIVAAESFTVSMNDAPAYSWSPNKLKAYADEEFMCGVNRIVIHDSAHQPSDSLVPGIGLSVFGQWFHRHDTWAERAHGWIDYLSRSSYLLQQGKAVVDAAYYYGEDNNVTALFSHQLPDFPAGIQYDFVSANTLLKAFSWDGEKFVTPCGMSYQVLVVDKNDRRMSDSVRMKLARWRHQGAKIIDSDELEQGLVTNGVTPDFMNNYGKDIVFVHRKTTEDNIFWVCNRTCRDVVVEASFRVSGQKPMMWNPENGQVKEVGYRIIDDRTTVSLPMNVNDAFFIVFHDSTSVDSCPQSLRNKIFFKKIDSPWKVSFDERWGGPEIFIMHHLKSYTDFDNDSVKYYSGTANYQNRFRLTYNDMRNLKQSRLLLDLGRVECMATIKLNGKSIGTLWRAPFTIDITDFVKKGDNTLEVEVVNQWTNRLIGDAQPDCPHKYTFTTYSYFSAASPLIPAGLIGPVTIWQEK